MPSKTERSIWTDETLKATMEVIERGTYSLRRPSKSWNIPMNSLANHLNGKTKSRKMGPRGVLTKEEEGETTLGCHKIDSKRPTSKFILQCIWTLTENMNI